MRRTHLNTQLSSFITRRRNAGARHL